MRQYPISAFVLASRMGMLDRVNFEGDPPPDPPSEGLTTEELEGVIGRVIDAKLEPITAKMEGLSSPDLDAFRKSLLEDVTGIITANKTTAVDEDGLLSKVGSMLDEKMKGLPAGSPVKRVGGPISRWLTAK